MYPVGMDDLRAIQERNRRVELEKAWETSLTRRLSIAVTTYVIATAFLWSINVETFYLQALVPTAGYVLSTLSLPWLKNRWMARRRSSEG